MARPRVLVIGLDGLEISVAQRLMAASLAAARELGATHVWLGVWERNPRAIAFYRKSGFREVGTQYFQLGSDRQRDLVVMREVP